MLPIRPLISLLLTYDQGLMFPQIMQYQKINWIISYLEQAEDEKCIYSGGGGANETQSRIRELAGENSARKKDLCLQISSPEIYALNKIKRRAQKLDRDATALFLRKLTGLDCFSSVLPATSVT